MAEVEAKPMTPEDEPFLRRLFEATRSAELALLPIDADQKLAFLDLQFRAQASHYRHVYPEATYSVLWLDGSPIGRITVDWAEDVRLVDIALLPEHRGSGIGTALLQDLIRKADEAGKPILLSVEQFNPAKKLYDRLGFEVEGGDGVYVRMRRAPR